MNRIIALVLLFFVQPAFSLPMISDFRLGLGTDLSGGLALGISKTLQGKSLQKAIELNMIALYGTVSETSNNGTHSYDESGSQLSIGALANYLHNYQNRRSEIYFITGAGLAVFFVDWQEKSATDTSLGTPLSGGGSMQSQSATVLGSVVNFGIGKEMRNGLDVRFEVPLSIIFSEVGGYSTVYPAFIFSASF